MSGPGTKLTEVIGLGHVITIFCGTSLPGHRQGEIKKGFVQGAAGISHRQTHPFLDFGHHLGADAFLQTSRRTISAITLIIVDNRIAGNIPDVMTYKGRNLPGAGAENLRTGLVEAAPASHLLSICIRFLAGDKQAVVGNSISGIAPTRFWLSGPILPIALVIEITIRIAPEQEWFAIAISNFPHQGRLDVFTVVGNRRRRKQHLKRCRQNVALAHASNVGIAGRPVLTTIDTFPLRRGNQPLGFA